MLKILHEKYKHDKKNAGVVLAEFVRSFDEAVEHNKDIEPLIPKIQVRIFSQNLMKFWIQHGLVFTFSILWLIIANYIFHINFISLIVLSSHTSWYIYIYV